jgi:hypothetical protein
MKQMNKKMTMSRLIYIIQMTLIYYQRIIYLKTKQVIHFRNKIKTISDLKFLIMKIKNKIP